MFRSYYIKLVPSSIYIPLRIALLEGYCESAIETQLNSFSKVPVFTNEGAVADCSKDRIIV